MAVSRAVCLSLILTAMTVRVIGKEGSWCVARSDASEEDLQKALDYACGTKADCLPIQVDGLCYLPNTIQAHASYAFNSFYQRSNRAPGSCDFTGTATIGETDPSYGSCVYPSTPSAAGGINTPNTPTTTPPMNNPYIPAPSTPTKPPASDVYGGGGGGGLSPGMSTTPFSDDSNSSASSQAMVPTLFLVFFSSLLILAIISN